MAATDNLTGRSLWGSRDPANMLQIDGQLPAKAKAIVISGGGVQYDAEAKTFL